jgi:hypothetical protein
MSEINDPIDRNGTFVTCSSMFGPASIDLDRAGEVAEWCARLGVTEERLRLIVSKVGPMANAVHAYMNSKGFAS